MIEEMRTIRTHLLATAACLMLCVGARAETLDVCPTGCTYASIQNAIDASSDGDTIAVAAGTYHEFDITLQGKAITISGDTDSDGLPAVTIDSQGMGTNIIGFFGEGNDTIIEHLVFTGCSGEGVAAVTMFHADPIMINCTFIDNVNTGLGGGAYNLNGSPHFIDCRFIDNSANWGGGYACWETGQPDHPVFLRCTFSGNTATLGGAIGNLRSSPLLTECVFRNNTATEHGGAFFNEGDDCCERWFGDVVMEQCVFEQNTAGQSGGAICNSIFGTTTLDGCTIKNNTAELDGSAIASSAATMAILTGSTVCSNTGTADQINGPVDLDDTNDIVDICPADCDGDITGDGEVNVSDLLAVIADWDNPYTVADILAAIDGWGPCP